MDKSIKHLAEALGATRTIKVPDTGGGAFGAAWLGHIVATIQGRTGGRSVSPMQIAVQIPEDAQAGIPAR